MRGFCLPLFPVLLLTVGCSGFDALRQPSPQLSGAPGACPVSGVGAVVSFGVATGSMLGRASLLNDGHSACFLTERVGVRLIDARGRPLSVRYQMESRSWLRATLGNQGADPAAGYIQGRLVLRPHGTAHVLLWWVNWCERPVVYPIQALIALPSHGGTLTARPGANPINTPRCDLASAPSVLRVGPVVQKLTIGGD
jgi:hypothetical protein